MTAPGMLDDKLQFSIVLALTAASAGKDVMAQQDARGHQLGMTRAEITAARQGLSFDYRSAKALALALASLRGSVPWQRSAALRAGIDAQTCARIEGLAAELGMGSMESIASPFRRKKNAT